MFARSDRTRYSMVLVPRAGWLDAMTDAGILEPLAAELVELYDAEHRVLLHPRGNRWHCCTTELDDTLRQLAGTAA
jgi:hypothetical protein